jgi:glutamate-1-semialdehyde aminotransferase
MNHASRTHEYFRKAEEADAAVQALREQAKELEAKLAADIAELEAEAEYRNAQAEMALLLADVASVLRDVDTRNLSEGKRVRVQGVRKRVFQALGVSP